jgi:hypothetical protein
MSCNNNLRPCYPHCNDGRGDYEDGSYAFKFTIPNFSGWIFNSVVFSLVIALIIVYSATKSFNKWSIVLLLLTALFFYLILLNTGDSILAASLPETTYPMPTHLDHLGISNEVLATY